MTGNEGPRDLAARFAFGGRAAYEQRVREQRKRTEAALVEHLRENADTLTDAEAVSLIRDAKIGTVRKQELREAWMTRDTEELT